MPGNLQIEQDQIVVILVMLFADLEWIHRGGDGNIAATTQHTLQQPDIGFQIVDDQDFVVKNVR